MLTQLGTASPGRATSALIETSRQRPFPLSSDNHVTLRDITLWSSFESLKRSPINWNTDNKSGFVALPTHGLFFKAAGPPRKATNPAVIIITGLGQDSRYWDGVVREISSFARVYSYDRSGYGRSEASPNPGRSASVLGLEVQQLLQAASVKGPYIVIAHSYGGIIAREVLALEKENIVGMVFVDANSEFSYKVRPEGLQDALGDLQENVDWHKLIGLEGHQKLTAEEWAAISDPEAGLTEEERKKHEKAAGEEWILYEPSCDELGKKEQYKVEGSILGGGVVSVVKGNNEGTDLKILYEEALKEGYGSEESREIVRRMLEMSEEEINLQKDQLKLSKRGRFVHAQKSGHDIHVTEPEMIVEEVRWILEVLCEEKDMQSN